VWPDEPWWGGAWAAAELELGLTRCAKAPERCGLVDEAWPETTEAYEDRRNIAELAVGCGRW
jgi:hypothetical protein